MNGPLAGTGSEEAPASEQAGARSRVVEIAPGDGTIRTAGNPIKTGCVGRHRPAPVPGEHNHLLDESVTA